MSTIKETKHDLRSMYGLACPECGHADRVTVEITCSAELTIDGSEACGDHYWDETSSCCCHACDHHATVAGFRVVEDKAVRS